MPFYILFTSPTRTTILQDRRVTSFYYHHPWKLSDNNTIPILGIFYTILGTYT